MNSELFVFSILAAVLGMAVVFIFLGILSFLMYGINRLFGERQPGAGQPGARGHSGGSKPAADAAGRQARAGSADGEDSGDRRWVVAAAAAFVLAEQLDLRRSAAAWQPRAASAVDPWLILPRL